MSGAPTPGAVSPELFRRALGHLAGGVSVVTSRDASGAPSGLTATAVCSASLDPPLVLVCLSRRARTSRAIRDSGTFALHFLARDQQPLAERFALGRRDKFAGLEVEEAATGAPILGAAIAYCDCRVVRAIPAGDHVVFIGRVEAARVLRPGEPEPLLRYDGRYRTLADGRAGGDAAGTDGP